MSSYILILIDKNRVHEFISLYNLISLKFSTSSEDTFSLKTMPIHVDLVYRILKSILNIGERTQKTELAYIAFYLFINLYQDFDQVIFIRVLLLF